MIDLAGVFGNPVGMWTLIKREMKRTFNIINQVIWPPVITTLLYVFVFGLALGSRIKNVQGVSYASFLIPGLIMLQVIDSSYAECSSSVFQGRFMNWIQEMLIAPLSAVEMVSGWIIGSVVRAIIIANIIMVLGLLLVHTFPQNWFLYFAVMSLVAMLFSAIGIIAGLMAEKFDHLAVTTTFAITPLIFVGGVFTPVQMLPPLIRTLSLFNPMFYTIDAFRYSFTGQSYLPLATSIAVIGVLTILATIIALKMTSVGYKLRT